jgi:hypothetical protein
VKTYGAFIRCSICGSQPFPDDPATRESFDLRRFGPSGAPAASPAEGEWRCERHFPPRQNIPPAARVTPDQALTEFERLLSAEGARLAEALPTRADDDDDDNEIALVSYRLEIERGLGELWKSIVPPRRATAQDDAPSRRPPKKITAKERLGTVDWLAGDAQPAGEDVS